LHFNFGGLFACQFAISFFRASAKQKDNVTSRLTENSVRYPVLMASLCLLYSVVLFLQAQSAVRGDRPLHKCSSSPVNPANYLASGAEGCWEVTGFKRPDSGVTNTQQRGRYAIITWAAQADRDGDGDGSRCTAEYSYLRSSSQGKLLELLVGRFKAQSMAECIHNEL
jgi:hypothetical protein